MCHADFTGVLHGESLAAAYANMDLLVFPSETDTFGNVVQEAMASGTPAVVSNGGGPRFIVRDGVSGFVAGGDHEYLDVARTLMADPGRHRRMRDAARCQALGASWDTVFDEVLEAYSAAAAVCTRVSRSSGGAGTALCSGESVNVRAPGPTRSVRGALAEVVCHPIRSVVPRWHWKSALLSAVLRAVLFFATSLAGGRALAARAAAVEFVLGILLAGFLAAVAQAFAERGIRGPHGACPGERGPWSHQDLEPAWAGTLVAMALIPTLAHVMEWIVHWFVGTPHLGAGMAASVTLSVLSTLFSLFVMRRGVMIVGSGGRAFGDDLRQLPRLLIEFALIAPRAFARQLKRLRVS